MSRFIFAVASLLTVWSSVHAVVRAQTVQVKPWFLVIVDTSGSMQTNCTNGASNPPTCTTCTNGCSTTVNSCGGAHSRINDARCALKNILNSTGDAEFALMQFRHACRAACDDRGSGDSSTCDADVKVTVSSSNYELLQWVDGVCQGTCNPGDYTKEIYSYGNTPIGQSMVRAKEFFSGIGYTSPVAADNYAGCRPVAVILLTDGDENCGGSPPTAAMSLRSTSVPTPKGQMTLDIKTYAVGFGLTPGNTNIEAIANNGGTDAPGAWKGFYAQDEESLSAALNSIITNSQLTERCDGRDNDCDTNIDEGYAKYCDVRGIRTQNPRVPSLANPSILEEQTGLPACSNNVCPAVSGVENDTDCAAPEWSSSSTCSPRNVLCTSPGEVCDGADDDCDGRVDENAPANPSRMEVCGDNVDNNCNGMIDEGCMGCIPQAEICNGLDDDCDTNVDEGVSRVCGTDQGECTAGTEMCTGPWPTSNPWTGCTAVGPTSETCNGKDDDCDGVIDGITRPCGPTMSIGVCRGGTETCTNDVWGSCIGAVTMSPEICDNLDNDCDGDPNDDGSDDSRVNVLCGNGMGVCMQGRTICSNGQIACSGATTGSTEICDGLDNDCDGVVDDGVAVTDPMNVGQDCIVQNGMVVYGPVMVTGQCKLGKTVCAGGKLTCPGYVGPTPELCDALDQDCDGQPTNGVTMTDPRVGASCGKSVGECVPGKIICTLQGMLLCDATDGSAETCNGKDDDCDGLIDEGLPVNPGPCETTQTPHGNVGECKVGRDACIRGANVCADEVTPTPEICDLLDNDCDGMTDEMDPGGGRQCGTNLGTCMSGMTKCMNGTVICVGDTGPGTELCDGMDNDCDGATDEDNPQGGGSCDMDSQGNVVVSSCRTAIDPTDANQPRDQPCGECRFGVVVCSAGVLTCMGAAGAKPELCDGLDNDCDSRCLIDQTDPAHPVRKCPTDKCDLPNSQQVDCDQLIDEGVEVTDPNIGVVCVGGSGECKQGTAQCVDGQLQCVGGQLPVPELCNGKDDDCDTLIDEGFALSTPCGIQVGECQQGVLVCDPETGQAKCQGENGKSDERCDGLDNDCDGVIDDGNPEGGADCGSDEGECRKGVQQCISGKLRCAGAQDAAPEVCDCLDNDCDGTVDEDPSASSAICPGQGQCEMCQCAQPCRDLGEFSEGCPTGKTNVMVDGKCLCVGERCNDQSCAAETLKSGDQVLCTPGSKSVGSCVCKNNQCASRCDGVICTDGLVCDATTGRCQERSCLLPQFACPAGQFCDITQFGCADDPCAGKECPAGDACRDGECLGSCANKQCGSGQRCRDGECIEDKCAAVSCENQVCDSTTGSCVELRLCALSGCKGGYICNQGTGACEPDACLRTRCPEGQLCRNGECEPRCAAPLILCDRECINPSSSRVHCGASGDCAGSNAGKVCEAEQVCSEGSCTETCKAGWVECEGGCVDPDNDPLHCGASGSCQGETAGIACPSGTLCKGGSCLRQTSGSDEPKKMTEAERRRVSVTGGGGCSCRVEGGSQRAPSPGLALVFGLLLLARWRRRLVLLARTHGRLWLALTVLALLALSSGCKVTPLCLNCETEDAGARGNMQGDGGPVDNPDDGGPARPKDAGPVVPGGDAAADSGGGNGMSDASTNRRDAGPGCVDTEICNGQDDDCDGKIDEGADPASLGINVQTDVKNCGVCGHSCALDHAFSRCDQGQCKIDGCDPEYTNSDDVEENGCEYRCSKISDKDTICDHRDDDCDKMIDDDVDFKTDQTNCGSCGNGCDAPNAVGGGVCDDGVCKLAPQSCKDGFVDADGVFANGCEYQCTPRNNGAELCNNADDDCDRRVDEAVFDTDTRLGVPCGSATGNCTQGVETCVGGAVVCQGGRGQITEACNGKDDDCDGSTDESFPQRGLPCGTDLGECSRGTQACIGGALACMGGTTSVAELCDGKDNDCDGRTDETAGDGTPPEHVGQSCSTSQGGVLMFDPPQPQGACRLGVAMCTAGHLVCVGEIGKKDELCDNIDQDCDGNSVYPNLGTDPQVGLPCGTDMGECRFGTTICQNGMRVCDNSNGRLPEPEACNGKDDDCDGKYDETDATTQVPPTGAGLACIVNSTTGEVITGSAATTQGACQVGTSVCSGGFIACPDYQGPQPELCDMADQDCDGNPLNGVESSDGRIGQPCSSGMPLGACRTGTQYCNNGVIACQGVVMPSPELCDGIDNDCDGDPLDDGADEPTLGLNCGTDTGDCSQGTLQCSGGVLQCVGAVGPSSELCDDADNDCDGMKDEDFQFMTDVNRCGGCNVQCSVAHGTPKCVNGMCQIASCDPDYHDDASRAGADCDRGPCTIAGAEICNGADDDCNGLVDDNLTPPGQFCNTNGACANAVPQCMGVNKWQCSILPAATELCNGIDDTCNRQTDEGFPVGQNCAATGVGACATKGTRACSPDGSTTLCADAQGNPVTTGTGGQEVCNGIDDDCDGNVDEPCGGVDMNCVTDAWVSLGNGTEIYQYEASRPDATDTTAGTSTARSCSAVNRLPWTNLTYLEARAACDAAGSTVRLCTEAEWEQACINDSMGSCTWGFPDYPGCNTWTFDQCNGVDRAATPVLQPGGHSGARDGCYRGPSSDPTKQIFELTGNVKEYVLARDTGAIPVRGGANNNTRDGLRCDFDFPVWPNGSAFSNVGFRCCRSASALPEQCATFQNTGLSINYNASLIENSVTVQLPGVITDVNVVNLKGNHSTMSQVNEINLTGPDGTKIQLTNTGYCGTSNNWSYVFDTEGGQNLPPASGSPCGGGLTFKPAQALTAFNGKNPYGTWTIAINDNNNANSNPTLTSWGVRICINPN